MTRDYLYAKNPPLAFARRDSGDSATTGFALREVPHLFKGKLRRDLTIEQLPLWAIDTPAPILGTSAAPRSFGVEPRFALDRAVTGTPLPTQVVGAVR